MEYKVFQYTSFMASFCGKNKIMNYRNCNFKKQLCLISDVSVALMLLAWF